MKLSQLTTGLTAAALLFSSVTASIEAASTAAASTSFKDVKSSDWYYSSIQKLISKELVNGFEDGTFKPNQEISRAEFLKLVDLSLQLDIPANLSGKPWYTPYVSAAVEAGIHRTSDFNGNWTQPISRQEMARITVRAIDQTLRNTKTSDTQLVYEATKRGILSGLTGGELGLKENSTRAQATVIVDRVLTVLNGGNLTADKRAASYAEVAYRGTNVQTMWGGSFRSLPFTSELRPNIAGEFKQILIIDLSDSNSPFRDYVPSGFSKINGQTWENDYLIAFKVTISNNKIIKDQFTFRSMVGSNILMPGIILPRDSKSPINSNQNFYAHTINNETIWALYTISKKELNELHQSKRPEFFFQGYGTSTNIIELNKNRSVF